MRAATWGRPYGEKRAGSVGSANSGADVGPQQLPFFSRSGPQWGRTGPHPSTQFLRAGNVLPTARGNPRNGGPGERRIWTRSVHPEPSPGDPLVSFPSLGKKLAARRRRNPPLRAAECIRSDSAAKRRFRTKFFCLLFFQEKQVNSSSSAWARESARPGPRRPWQRRGGPAAPGRSPAGRRTPPYLPPACRGRG